MSSFLYIYYIHIKPMSKIELNKAYEAKLSEDGIYQKWEDSGFFNPDNLPGDRSDEKTGLFFNTFL